MGSQLVFVGSYAEANQPGIQTFEFDGVTGALRTLAFRTGIANPTFLAVNPKRPCLYAVSEMSGGGVSSFRFNERGTLEYINRQPSGGTRPVILPWT